MRFTWNATVWTLLPRHSGGGFVAMTLHQQPEDSRFMWSQIVRGRRSPLDLAEIGRQAPRDVGHRRGTVSDHGFTQAAAEGVGFASPQPEACAPEPIGTISGSSSRSSAFRASQRSRTTKRVPFRSATNGVGSGGILLASLAAST